MIKLRVEWHHNCPGCGTQLVVDFFDDLAEACVCPWCGCIDAAGPCAAQDELKDYVTHAVSEIEQTANGRLTVTR